VRVHEASRKVKLVKRKSVLECVMLQEASQLLSVDSDYRLSVNTHPFSSFFRCEPSSGGGAMAVSLFYVAHRLHVPAERPFVSIANIDVKR
jgi:hypothetical protein